jgi:hypothetical protein
MAAVAAVFAHTQVCRCHHLAGVGAPGSSRRHDSELAVHLLQHGRTVHLKPVA